MLKMLQGKMLSVLLGLGITALASLAAAAADLRMPAPRVDPVLVNLWQGTYVGAHAGYLWSRAEISDLGTVIEPNAPVDGFVGGILAGHNWQYRDWVFGLEGDFGWSNAKGTGTAEPNVYELDWNAHLRARVGITPGNGAWLFFLTGGLSAARFTFIDGGTMERTSANYFGGTAGLGADYRFSPKFTGRFEYLYDFFQSGAIVAHDYEAKLLNASTLRAALIFKLN